MIKKAILTLLLCTPFLVSCSNQYKLRKLVLPKDQSAVAPFSGSNCIMRRLKTNSGRVIRIAGCGYIWTEAISNKVKALYSNYKRENRSPQQAHVEVAKFYKQVIQLSNQIPIWTPKRAVIISIVLDYKGSYLLVKPILDFLYRYEHPHVRIKAYLARLKFPTTAPQVQHWFREVLHHVPALGLVDSGFIAALTMPSKSSKDQEKTGLKNTWPLRFIMPAVLAIRRNAPELRKICLQTPYSKLKKTWKVHYFAIVKRTLRRKSKQDLEKRFALRKKRILKRDKQMHQHLLDLCKQYLKASRDSK